MSGVHQISEKKSSGGYNLISPEQFMAYNIIDRMRLVREKKVEFLDDAGDIMD